MSTSKQPQGFLKWLRPVAVGLLVTGAVVGTVVGGNYVLRDTKNSDVQTAQRISPTKPFINLDATTVIIAAATTIITIILHMDRKIDNTNQKIDSARNDFDSKIDSTNSKVDNLGSNLTNKIDSLGSSLTNKIDRDNQEMRDLFISSVRGFNARIDTTNQRIDQVYRDPSIKSS